jgi:putative membrane protein
MSTSGSAGPSKRPPQVFEVTDPAVVVDAALPEPVMAPAVWAKSKAGDDGEGEARAGGEAPDDAVRAARFRPGWGSVLVGALGALASLALGIAFTDFVSTVLARADWLGLVGWALLGIAIAAALVIAVREIVGLMRLGRLAHLRRDAERALAERNAEAERVVVRRLRGALGGRPDIAWASARFAEHERDVRDPGDLLALADRELMAPLDAVARRDILASAKRVSLVTALSPMPFIAMGFVLVENLRLLRRLATLYGGRPGFLGGLRMARMVLVHILATGGLALTDDLVGQFVGQDLVRRLSRRLGEGLFNGALTARIGVAALDVCRPLPFVEAKPVRLRDIVAELTRRAAAPPPAAR